MTNRLRLALAACALAAAIPVFAQSPSVPPSEAPAPVLTLEECVARALQQNFDVSIQRLTTESAAREVDIARAAYDPTFSASTTRSYTKNPPDTTTITSLDAQGNVVNIARTTDIRTDAQSSSVAVSQKVITGATVEVSGDLNRSRRIPATSTGLNPIFLGDVALTVRQPLLKGAGLGLNRAATERAKLGLERSNQDLRSTVLGVVRNVESAYYNLAFARQQLEVRRFSLEVAQKLLEENQAKRATGVATDLDVLQSEVNVATAQHNLVLSEQTVHNAEDSLLQLIGRNDFNQQLGAVKFLDDAVPDISFDRSYKLARDNAPEFLSSQLLIKQLELDVKTAKNSKLPDVNLGGGIGYTSREASYGEAARDIGKGYNWQVDLSVSVPWKFRAADANYRQAQLAIRREQVRLDKLDQALVVDVRSAIRSVQTNLESVRLSALSSQLSQKQFELEKARYDAGLSTFRFVQQAQADLDAARVSELEARVNLRTALADLARLEGSSLARYNISLAPTK